MTIRLPVVPTSFFGTLLGLCGLGGSGRAAHRVWGVAEQPGGHFVQADSGADQRIVLIPPSCHRVHDAAGRGGEISTVSFAEIEARDEIVQWVHHAYIFL
ncbi:hypothetical protein [Acetobacter nitrogenifigens]|nr:hypothetical protein [Acetobacter nitrogenifigens]